MGRAIAVTALALALPAGSAWAQEAAARARPRAFDGAVTIGAGLAFNGTRAEQGDDQLCPARVSCISHAVSNTPMVSVDLQVPLARVIGLSVGASAGRPARILCDPGCASTDRVTAIRGQAMVLIRLKPRAPIYFGFGASGTRFDPGPVNGQNDATVEWGGSLVVGYDFQLSSRVGGRIAWWNFLSQPDASGLGTAFEVKGLTYDAMIAFGARIRLF